MASTTQTPGSALSLTLLLGGFLFLQGCFLAPPIVTPRFEDPPEQGTRFHCTAQIQSTDGHVEVLSNLNHWDLTYEFDGYRLPRREFRTCSGANCPPCDYYQEGADIEGDWADYIDLSVPRLANQPASVVGRHQAPWCVWEETLSCAPVGPVVSRLPLECGTRPLAPSTLPSCEGVAPPDPGERCLEVLCNGEPCDEYDFGIVGTNVTTPPLRIHVSHCGDATTGPLLIVTDPDPIEQTSGPGDPGFLLSRNGCERTGNLYSSSVRPDDSNCSIDVVFGSREAASHTAAVVVHSSLPAEHRIELRAQTVSDAPAGELTFEIEGLPDPTAIPDSLCVDRLEDTCTPTRTVRAIAGTAPVEILDQEIVVAGQGWEIVPGPVTPPVTLLPGQAHEIEVRWCQTDPSSATATLVVRSDSTEPTFELDLMRLDGTACPPGT